MQGFAAGWHRYWHDFETERARLVALRFALFGILAFDMWGVTLEHAARYGAGGFNVAQIGLLDQLLGVPDPAIIAVGWLLGGFFCLRAAFGIAIRASMIGASICYFGIYLWSQADSYQHHYLVGLLITFSCFIPEQVWQATPPDELDEEARARWHRIKHWGIRLIYVQLALMYFWTGVTKADPTWLTGATMDTLTTKPSIRAAMAGFEQSLGLESGQSYAYAAVAVMVGEIAAAVFFLFRRLWLVGLLIVPWFHIGVEVLEFDIEWFSYYMIGIDLILLLPDKGWAWITRVVSSTRSRLAPASIVKRMLQPKPTESGPRMVIALVTAGVAGLWAGQLPIEGADTLLIVVALATLLALWPNPLLAPRAPIYAAVGQVAVVGFMTLTVYQLESLYDMYRLWGGDLRRRGDLEAAAEKYARANELMADRPARRYQLARIYGQLGRTDDAFMLYEEAMAIQQSHVDALITQTHKSPTDADLFFELGFDQLRLVDRCQAMERQHRARGNTDAAEVAERCARQALLGAEEAADKGQALAPRDREGFKLRHQVERERSR